MAEETVLSETGEGRPTGRGGGCKDGNELDCAEGREAEGGEEDVAVLLQVAALEVTAVPEPREEPGIGAFPGAEHEGAGKG